MIFIFIVRPGPYLRHGIRWSSWRLGRRYALPQPPDDWKDDMGWFSDLCRNTGLMLHNVKHPEKAVTNKQVVSEKIEEQKVSETMTLRRTTVEEIEVRLDEEVSEG